MFAVVKAQIEEIRLANTTQNGSLLLKIKERDCIAHVLCIATEDNHESIFTIPHNLRLVIQLVVIDASSYFVLYDLGRTFRNYMKHDKALAVRRDRLSKVGHILGVRPDSGQKLGRHVSFILILRL